VGVSVGSCEGVSYGKYMSLDKGELGANFIGVSKRMVGPNSAAGNGGWITFFRVRRVAVKFLERVFFGGDP
jgi:hypothetical protein